jgi:tetratricopeptide (TPR) repeat protein
MTTKFASKEIHFLKTDSEQSEFQPPEHYFSDLLLTKPSLFRTFNKNFKAILLPEESFLCAALHLIAHEPDDTQANAKKVFESTFKKLVKHEQGVWKNIDDTAFILGLRGYENEEQAANIISQLKESLSQNSYFDVIIGTAMFPCLNYPQTQIPVNALKALDHAAFFGASALVSFDALSLNISGDRLYHLNHYNLAIKEYKEGLKMKPDDNNMLNSLGVCFAISGELKKARKAFNSALKSRQDELISIYNIGLLHQIEGESDKAMDYFKKAHKIDNSVFEVELLLAYLFFKKGEYKKVMPYLDAAKQLNPESGMVFRIMGEILLEENYPENAAFQFNNAIKLNPSDAVSLSGYARCLELMNKNLSIALIFAQKSLALDPENPLFQERLKSLSEKLQKT